MKKYWWLIAAIVWALVIALLSFSCQSTRTDKDWKIFTHLKGWHGSDPASVQFGKWPEVFQMQVMFDSTCKYLFYNSDGSIAENQYDYNKAGGWSFDEVTARKNSCMIGWRYGPESRKIELTFYHHSQGVAVHNSDPVTAVGFRQVATYTMIPNYKTGEVFESIEAGGVVAENSFDMPAIIGTGHGREINCWFGGQEKPPHKMFILKKRIR